MKQSKFHNKQILINKSLPHNFLAEKMILSCLLINSEAIEITTKTISIDVFYFKNHQEIYKAIIFMYQNKIRIDIVAVLSMLTLVLLGIIGVDDALAGFSNSQNTSALKATNQANRLL